MSNRLALGTVQFGLPYGISNQVGLVSTAEVESIVALARQAGMDTLDTAMAYGTSETTLGEVGVSDFKVVTKLPNVPAECVNVEGWVYDQVLGSLKRLRVKSVHAVLLHQSKQIWGPHGMELRSGLERLKSEGLIGKIGVSIYSPDELTDLLSVFPVDIVQAPFSLVDQRLAMSGWLIKLHNAGIEIHVRSIFLQGLLLMHRADIPEKFERWRATWDVWHEWLAAQNDSASQVCYRFVNGFSEIDRIVTGFHSTQQLRHLLDATVSTSPSQLPELKIIDDALINPANWSSL